MDTVEQGFHFPEDVVWEILTHLPAKSVIRFRVVCKAWRYLTSTPEFLEAHHRHQRPLPLLLPLHYDHDGEDDLPLHLFRLEAIDLRDSSLWPVIQFSTDGENVAYAPDDMFVFAVHAFIDGLLLVSFVNDWYVCNPVTRQWAPLPMLNSSEVVGFYAHRPSGEYRVLYQKGTEDPDVNTTCYYIFTVGSQEARSVGCPISPAAHNEKGATLGVEGALFLPPALADHNLHWPPQEDRQYFMMVFDTEAEVFSWMNPPAINSCIKLFEIEGKLGMSISGVGGSRVDLWILDDYRNQIWALAFRIDLPEEQIMSFGSGSPLWVLYVVSLEGDVLVECQAHWLNRGGVLVESLPRLLLFDKNGKLQAKFCFHGYWATATSHLFKASLLPHAIFQTGRGPGAPEPPFFLGL